MDPLVHHTVDNSAHTANYEACIYTTKTHLTKTQAWADIPARANLRPLLDRGEAGTTEKNRTLPYLKVGSLGYNGDKHSQQCVDIYPKHTDGIQTKHKNRTDSCTWPVCTHGKKKKTRRNRQLEHIHPVGKQPTKHHAS